MYHFLSLDWIWHLIVATLSIGPLTLVYYENRLYWLFGVKCLNLRKNNLTTQDSLLGITISPVDLTPHMTYSNRGLLQTLGETSRKHTAYNSIRPRCTNLFTPLNHTQVGAVSSLLNQTNMRTSSSNSSAAGHCYPGVHLEMLSMSYTNRKAEQTSALMDSKGHSGITQTQLQLFKTDI